MLHNFVCVSLIIYFAKNSNKMKEQKLKRYRLVLSRKIPSSHPMKGEETGFQRK